MSFMLDTNECHRKHCDAASPCSSDFDFSAAFIAVRGVLLLLGNTLCAVRVLVKYTV